MKNLRSYGFMLAFFAIMISFAQTPDIDSLKRKLKESMVDSAKMDILYELSKAQCAQLETSAALKSAKMAEVLAKKLNSKKGLSKAYHSMGNVYIQEGNYADALEFHLKALAIKEELGDKQGIAASYNNIGHIYNSNNNFSEAIACYNKSIDIKYKLLETAKKENNEKEIRRILLSIASSSNSLGTNLDELNKHEEAIGYYMAALKIHESFNNLTGAAGSVENMGVSYYMLKKYDKALELFNRVYDIRNKNNDTSLLGGTYLNLGKTNLILKRFDKAEDYLLKALKLSRYVRMTDVTRDSYRGLYELDTCKKNYRQALFYYKRFIKFRDSISNEAVTKRMTRLQMNHSYETKEKEALLVQEKKDALAKEKSEFQNVIIISMSILFVIIIGFVIYAAINFKQKQKLNKEITLQKMIIEEKQSEILASIKYAKRIQTTLLPTEHYINKELNRLM